MRIKIALFCMLILLGCSSTADSIKKDVAAMPQAWEPQHPDNVKFLEENPKSPNLFHVLLTSENYIVSQMYALETIARTEDKSGDKYYSGEIKQFDIIDEVREGTFSVTIFPDSGKLNKIRPERLTFLHDIDNLISEDIQRWTFKSPRKRSFEPTKFNIKYRVILHKSQSDEEILRRIRERAK
jgi:hypothetical protein